MGNTTIKEEIGSTPENDVHNKLGLDDDSICALFERLSRADLARIACVCKTWLRLSSHQEVWKALAKSRWGTEFVVVMEEMSASVNWRLLNLAIALEDKYYLPPAYFSPCQTSPKKRKKKYNKINLPAPL